MPRTLEPGQHAQLFVCIVETGESRLVYESAELLFEAPNWIPGTDDLLINGDGNLFRIPADGSGEPVQIDLAGVPEINNDHVISPDGSTVYVSAEDGHLYAVPIGGGVHRRVSNDRGPSFRYYLHGISPDGSQLVYIGLAIDAGGSITTNVFTIPAEGGSDLQLTNDEHPDDGAEFSPDGEWIYFNSERASIAPGHAQLFRMRPDAEDLTQLTSDERVNWFPHLSPDGSAMAFISFPPGTLGHPANLDVIIRLSDPDGGDVRDLVHLFGGQGTINVPSWSSDGARLAYVAYPRG